MFQRVCECVCVCFMSHQVMGKKVNSQKVIFWIKKDTHMLKNLYYYHYYHRYERL